MLRWTQSVRTTVFAILASLAVGLVMFRVLDVAFRQLHLQAGIADDTGLVIEGIVFPLSVMLCCGTAAAVSPAIGLRRFAAALAVPAILWPFLLWSGIGDGFIGACRETFDWEAKKVFGQYLHVALYVCLSVVASTFGVCVRVQRPKEWQSAIGSLAGGLVIAMALLALYYPVLVGQVQSEHRWLQRVVDVHQQWKTLKSELHRYEEKEMGNPFRDYDGNSVRTTPKSTD